MVTIGNTTLDERLRVARRRRGWSLRQLAAVTGLSHTTILKIEQGRVPNPGTDTLQRLAQALQIPFSELVTDKPFPTIHERLDRILKKWPNLNPAFAHAGGRIDEDAIEFLVNAVEAAERTGNIPQKD